MASTVRVTANIPITSPTIAGFTTTEDCDDEATACHSGTETSEDYQPTGSKETLCPILNSNVMQKQNVLYLCNNSALLCSTTDALAEPMGSGKKAHYKHSTM